LRIAFTGSAFDMADQPAMPIFRASA